MAAKEALRVETVPIDLLTAHPDNYRTHGDDQLAHLRQSLTEYGWARNVVVARDNVILAGHGIVEAARQAGHTEVPVYRMDVASDDPKARKFLVLENSVQRLAQDDDTALVALLASIQQTSEGGLSGTGFDDSELDNLIGEMAAEEFGKGLPEEFKEVDPTEDEFQHRCPKCGFEWDDSG